jgi:hypothetical protein
MKAASLVFFSRLHQFQALLLGLAIADGVQQGQITDATLPPRSPASITSQDPLTAPDWCQDFLTTSRWLSQMDAPPPPPRPRRDGFYALSWVPLVLCCLDQPAGLDYCLATGAPLVSPEDPANVAALYTLLQAVLTSPGHAADFNVQSSAADNLQTLWRAAIALTHQTEGDFRQTLGVALWRYGYASPVPLWAALFSAAQRGLGTLPIPWRQALVGLLPRTPDSQAADWLQHRWASRNRQDLMAIATALESRWAGRLPTT